MAEGRVMAANTTLKDGLISEGLLTKEQVARAEDYALTMNLSLDEALIFLKMLNYASLGGALSKIHQKPYVPLLHLPPDEAARGKVSANVAESLKVFPYRYHAKSSTLTLAVSDPNDRDLLKNLSKSVSSSLNLDLTVASASEILTAIDIHYKGKTYSPDPELELPRGFTIVAPGRKTREGLDLEEEAQSGTQLLLLEQDLDRARALMTLLRREGFPNVRWVASPKDAATALQEKSADMLVANGRMFKPQGAWIRELPPEVLPSFISNYNIRSMLLGQEHPYTQMSEALVSLVTFIVRQNVKDKDQLQEILTTARYCKLLSMRLGLASVEVDGVVLATWLCAPGIGKLIREHLPSPYPIDEILNPPEGSASGLRIEAQILALVRRYMDLKKDRPEISGDMDKVRRELEATPGAVEGKPLLEAFLSVIKDEEFLRNAGQAGRRILLVDPEGSKESALALRLSNDGYEVTVVSDARQAIRVIFDMGTDLVLSEVNLPGTDGLRFCRALRDNPASANLSFFIMTAEDGPRLAAQCLEAGADDFFKKPVDLEMLSLKIRNMLNLKSSRGTKKGITGTLQDMSATDIIQTLTIGEKDVEVHFSSKKQKGVIFIRQGEIIHAKTERMEGQDAFYQLMAWEDGEFEITTSANFPERTIHDSAMSLLMEWARLADEASVRGQA
ncbi:MAG: response regulator [Smithellaceae bacterium]